MPYLSFLLRIILGAYFLYAAIPKIFDPLAFATAISHYHILPLFAVNAFALVVPWLELLVGVCLVVGYNIKTAALLYFILLFAFTVAVAIAVVQGLKIDCGCFGADAAEEVGWFKVFKNSLLLGGSVVLWFYPRSVLAIESLRGQAKHDI
ncbi:MAG: DoxX family membrane protein [Ignavibacteria bacterium]|nr:DoxX family membrane protein [Ignavibacteria bacterium]